MPAITVDNTLALPRIDPLAIEDTVERRVTSVTTAPRGFEGEGFPVRRAFHGVDMTALDPFIHLDQMGEVCTGFNRWTRLPTTDQTEVFSRSAETHRCAFSAPAEVSIAQATPEDGDHR